MSHPETRSNSPKPGGGADADLQSDPRWQLVERILQTGPFQKSSNLHHLLSFLAEQTLLGKSDALTERQVGIAVFGKPADYSPAEDSAVRVHARQLRLRLHEYFGQEGRTETLRIEIPKGSYALDFHNAVIEIEPPFASTAPSPASPIKARTGVRNVLFAIAVAAAVVCAVGWVRTAQRNAHPAVPWPLDSVIQPNRLTRIVVSDSSTMLRELGQHEFTLDDYLQPDFRQKLIPGHPPEHFDRLLTYIETSQLTSFADLTAATTLMKLAGPMGTQIVLTSARDLDRRDLERGNFVFVGSPTSNPWVEIFAEKLNFQQVEEGIGGRMYFLNRKPLPGEAKEYEGLASTGSTGEDYATISVLPGPIGQGNVMILQGLRQEGTEALSALLADADDRDRLEKALQGASGRPSPYFEALVRSRAVAGAPVSVDIVAVRTIQP